jgi:HD-like signal output (HDOD) protein
LVWNVSNWIAELEGRVGEVMELPAIPEVAQAILRLRNDPRADARRLGQLIELDPSLSAQIVRCAASAFFGYRGKLDSIQDAISRVLGFEKAMYIAVGLSAGKALRYSNEGPLGVKAFWTHAVFTAELMQALGAELDPGAKPSPGLAYLAGLLHNIGVMLLGHLLEPEFNALNRAVAEQPDRSLLELETELLGVSHCDLGVWLLRKWKMPTEVLTTVLQHHNDDYHGTAATYVRLAQVSNAVLKRHGVGDAATDAISDRALEALGISEQQVLAVAERVLAKRPGIESLVQQVVWAA